MALETDWIEVLVCLRFRPHACRAMSQLQRLREEMRSAKYLYEVMTKLRTQTASHRNRCSPSASLARTTEQPTAEEDEDDEDDEVGLLVAQLNRLVVRDICIFYSWRLLFIAHFAYTDVKKTTHVTFQRNTTPTDDIDFHSIRTRTLERHLTSVVNLKALSNVNKVLTQF